VQTMTIPPRFSLTTSEAARRLGLSGQHTIRLARSGQLPHVRTPLGRLYDEYAVARLAQERRRVFAA
jgi:excisionase family DNA binding protein